MDLHLADRVAIVTGASKGIGLQVNFFSALRAIRAVLPPMLEQGGGAIVNIISVNAFFEPDGGTIDYGAAKAALLNINKSLAQEFGPRGIRVNGISPGPVATDLWLGDGGVAHTVSARTGTDPDTARDAVLQKHRRPGHGPADDPRRGRDARGHARLRPDGEPDRLQLRDRRRAAQDDLTPLTEKRA